MRSLLILALLAITPVAMAAEKEVKIKVPKEVDLDFKKADADGSGELSGDEIVNYLGDKYFKPQLVEAGLSEEQATATGRATARQVWLPAFMQKDADGNGELSEAELS